jgi:steroid delta-isomerase-like uncharacterized protein
MSIEINKKVILRLFNEGITEKKFEVFDELISEKFIKHGVPNAPGGIGGFKTGLQQFIQAFPDIKVSIQQIIAEGESVATRGFFQGTHQGNFMGVPATGRKVRVEYMDFWKLNDGKCTENWVQMDLHGIMQQIGSLETAL